RPTIKAARPIQAQNCREGSRAWPGEGAMSLSGMVTYFAFAKQIVLATATQGGVLGALTYVWAVVPATLALGLFGRGNVDAQVAFSCMYIGTRDDQHEAQVFAQGLQEFQILTVGVDVDFGCQGGTDGAGATYVFNAAHHVGTDGAQALPLAAQCRLFALLGQDMEQFGEDGAARNRTTVHVTPGFFCREGQDRGHQLGQGLCQVAQRRLSRATWLAIF